MSIRISIAVAMLAVSVKTAVADDHSMTTGFALSNSGKTLTVIADLAEPQNTFKSNLPAKLDALAWRPVTSELLGFSRGKIYKVDPTSGALTDLNAAFMDDAMISKEAMVAFDFNNKIDAVRAVSSVGDNLVYFPKNFGDGDKKAGSVRRFSDLAYAPEDMNANVKPEVFANAYTNAINGKKAKDTYQYALDAETDALVSLANNKGTLNTIGAITIDGQSVNISAMGGFDIVSEAEGKNSAYAILKIEGSSNSGLYSIDLTSGAAMKMFDMGNSDYNGFAVSLIN